MLKKFDCELFYFNILPSCWKNNIFKFLTSAAVFPATTNDSHAHVFHDSSIIKQHQKLLCVAHKRKCIFHACRPQFGLICLREISNIWWVHQLFAQLMPTLWVTQFSNWTYFPGDNYPRICKKTAPFASIKNFSCIWNTIKIHRSLTYFSTSAQTRFFPFSIKNWSPCVGASPDSVRDSSAMISQRAAARLKPSPSFSCVMRLAQSLSLLFMVSLWHFRVLAVFRYCRRTDCALIRSAASEHEKLTPHCSSVKLNIVGAIGQTRCFFLS